MTRFLAGLLLGLLVGAVLLRYQYKEVIYWEHNFNTAIEACESDDDQRNTDTNCWFQDDIEYLPNFPQPYKSPSVRSENSHN